MKKTYPIKGCHERAKHLRKPGKRWANKSTRKILKENCDKALPK